MSTYLGTCQIDDSHPRAASLEAELGSRNDTLYVECYIRGPKDFNRVCPCRLPSLQDCYTCFAEGYVAWKEGISEDFVIGIPDVEKIDLVDRLLDKYKFNLGPFSGKNGDMIKTVPQAKLITDSHSIHVESKALRNVSN